MKKNAVLYKYFPPERIDVLRGGMIRLTQLAALNDPFDCRPRFLEPEELPAVPTGEHCCVNWYIRFIQESWLSADRASVGLLCLSEKPDNLLMWAHYAQDHKGFVIGFDVSHEFFSKSPDGTGLWKVKYSITRPHWPKNLFSHEVNRQPSFTPGTAAVISEEHEFFNPDSDAKDYRFVKSPEWKYEQEWRLLRAIKPPYYVIQSNASLPIYLFPFPPSIIQSVIIGCRGYTNLYPEISRIIEQEPRYGHVKLHSMSTHGRQFRLQIGKPLLSYANLDSEKHLSIPADEEPFVSTWINRSHKHIHNCKEDNTVLKGRTNKDDNGISNNTASELDEQSTKLNLLVASVGEALKKRGIVPYQSKAVKSDKLLSIKSAEECFELSLTLFLQGNHEEALSALSHAFDLSSTKHEGLYSVGLIMRTIGNHEEAIWCFQEAIRCNPMYADAHWSLGNSHEALGHVWPTEASYRTALRCDPAHAQARTSLGNVLMKQKHVSEAEACYRIAIKDDTNRWEAHCNLIGLLVANERYDEALEQLDVAINIKIERYACLYYYNGLCHHITNMIVDLDSNTARKESITSILVTKLQNLEIVDILINTLRAKGYEDEAIYFLKNRQT